MDNTNNNSGLKPYLSPAAVWAISLGTAIGWGSLVVTSNNYLLHAGPLGSVIGMLIGALVMIVISKNYAYLMRKFPDAGGAYAFTKHAFGYDQGFLTGWFLLLTYISIFWANATSLPLFAYYFFGDIFRFGYMYSMFGYDVYIGEVILTIAAIVLFALLCISFKKSIAKVMIALALLLTLGITICFVAAMLGHGGSGASFEPLFTENGNALSQIVRITCISPWAFIGFESISNLSEEFTFAQRKISRIFITTVITTTALYIFVTLLSVTAYPAEYSSWIDYIKDLGNLEGIEKLPAFYAANYYLGRPGITILVLTLLALIITSLIGNMLALSRLCYAGAKDDILPSCLADLNKKHIPAKAILLVMGISIIIPFFGRTAIGWIVDVTTIGSTIIYGFVSASAAKIAKEENILRIRVTGSIGMGVMILFGLYLLIPELFVQGAIEKETYFLFTTWAFLGFVFFRHILKTDKEKRFGNSIVVWIALLSLILFTSLVWLSKSMMSMANGTLENVREYFESIIGEARYQAMADTFLDEKLDEMRSANIRSIMIVTAFFGASIAIMLNNYTLMKNRIAEHILEIERAKYIATVDPLTGVRNKLAYTAGERSVNEQISTGLIREFAMVVCDVNGLKHINDTLGHKAGDEYICSAAKLISYLFAHSPVFRIGGDEFAVYLVGEDYQNRHEILAELNRQVENAVKNGGVVVSAGVSDYIDGKDNEVRNVFERADEMMYKRKKQLKEMGAITRD